MTLPSLIEKDAGATPLHVVSKKNYPAWLKSQKPYIRTWLNALGYAADPGKWALAPAADGTIALAVAGQAEADIWSIAALAHELPARAYTLASPHSTDAATGLALGWALGAYRFTRYKSKSSASATLVIPKEADAAYVRNMAEAAYLARDLINTPAADMLPAQLAEAAVSVAKAHKAKASVLVGEELLSNNYPTIYTVGKGSAVPPRLVDIRWGKAGAPKVTLVGKGVCFDSGGLDIKGAANMRLMKKDMAGAAIQLALASLIMRSKLNVQLRVLLPMVENAIDGNSMRPLDVVKTRKGITVEIGDTDAEGRLILCDALAEADSESPDLIIDCSTLTGAARVALGTDMPAFFCTDDKVAAQLAKHSAAQAEPLFRLPLHAPYRDMLKSDTADISNDTGSGYAGAITAALFLKEFVENTRAWLHMDMMAWNLSSRPGRPTGGEAQALRSLFALLQERYGSSSRV